MNLKDRIGDIYLNIDMDAFEISEGAANRFGASGGADRRLG